MHKNKHILAGYAGGKSLRKKPGMLFPHGRGVGLPKATRTVHKQPKVPDRERAVRKKRYRRWLRKHGLPITKYHYTDYILPPA